MGFHGSGLPSTSNPSPPRPASSLPPSHSHTHTHRFTLHTHTYTDSLQSMPTHLTGVPSDWNVFSVESCLHEISSNGDVIFVASSQRQSSKCNHLSGRMRCYRHLFRIFKILSLCTEEQNHSQPLKTAISPPVLY